MSHLCADADIVSFGPLKQAHIRDHARHSVCMGAGDVRHNSPILCIVPIYVLDINQSHFEIEEVHP